MSALHDVLTHAPRVDWAEYDSATSQIREHTLINHLQVPILAVDAQGHCIAASDGTMRLTGYSRSQLLATSVLQDGFAGTHMSMEPWGDFLAHRQYVGTITITNGDENDVTVHEAAVAEIMPDFHVAALAAA